MFAYMEQYSTMRGERLQIDPNSPEALARRLKVLRCGLGWSQEYASGLLGSATEGQMWGNWEAGTNVPDFKTQLRIAKATTFPIMWIAGGDPTFLSDHQKKIIAVGGERVKTGWRANRRLTEKQ